MPTSTCIYRTRRGTAAHQAAEEGLAVLRPGDSGVITLGDRLPTLLDDGTNRGNVLTLSRQVDFVAAQRLAHDLARVLVAPAAHLGVDEGAQMRGEVHIA